MPVKQLPDPCYALGGDRMGAHFTEPGEGRSLLPAPCLIAECDGLPGLPCGEPMSDDDEFGVVHFASEDEAREFAEVIDWTVTPDGCAGTVPGDKYELAVTPPDRDEYAPPGRWLTWRSHYPAERGTGTHLFGCALAAAWREKAEREAVNG